MRRAECEPFGKSYSRGLSEVQQESPSSSSSKHGRIIPAQSLYLGLSHPATLPSTDPPQAMQMNFLRESTRQTMHPPLFPT